MTWVRLVHELGLTELTDDEVTRYEKMVAREKALPVVAHDDHVRLLRWSAESSGNVRVVTTYRVVSTKSDISEEFVGPGFTTPLPRNSNVKLTGQLVLAEQH